MDTYHLLQKPHGVGGFLSELSAEGSPILGAKHEKSLAMLQVSAIFESWVLMLLYKISVEGMLQAFFSF